MTSLDSHSHHRKREDVAFFSFVDTLFLTPCRSNKTISHIDIQNRSTQRVRTPVKQTSSSGPHCAPKCMLSHKMACRLFPVRLYQAARYITTFQKVMQHATKRKSHMIRRLLCTCAARASKLDEMLPVKVLS